MAQEPVTTRHLPVTLDAFRRQALTNQMVAARMEELRITEHLKRVQESLRQMVKEQQKLQNQAAEALTHGYEMQEVACLEEVDAERGLVVLRRLDTQEVVEERPTGGRGRR